MAFSAACQPVNVDKFPDPGHIVATVSDQNNAPVAGATVELLIPENGLMWRSAQSDAYGISRPGEADNGVLPGSYNAKITAPSGYAVPATQQNPIAITVQSNKTVSIAYKLTKGP